ncbi:rRNA methyltransferase 1, mitochondrial isoform X1 [Oncorhynchus kisutch]|uniref:rRNA methyltransferase 1, mitochondrial n=1 Tax=Oncorhynchus kisutch TaxID=8019 RepID=A0A8C7KG68_ONCKI|nr:rRNA methyltransferase 1, mitochondrial isoform X1 [Oncorhynchus kisutch]
MYFHFKNMGTWNLACRCSRMFVNSRLLNLVSESDMRVGCHFASYHCASALLWPKDSRVKPAEGWRSSAITSSGMRHRPAVSEVGKYKAEGQSEDIKDDPETPASRNVWRKETSVSRERKPNTDSRVSSEFQRGAPIKRERKTNTDSKMSSELRKLSLDDFPEECERLVKDSRERLSKEEHSNYETLFGVSPCLLALTQGRRNAHRLFVKEGEASRRASVRQVCEEAHRQGVPIQRVSKNDLNKMCSGGVHQGLCLQASFLGFLTEDKTSKPPRDSSHIPLWLVLDRVQDPMNLGAILRSAYFLGVDGVASSLRNSCPLTPVVSKASSGVMEVMRVYGYDSLVDMVKVKVAQGWQVIGTVGAEAENSHVPVMKCSKFQMTKPTLLLMGGEGEGLSRELRLHCEVMLTIPSRRDLHPGVESLNVSVATGILLHSLLSSHRGGH